MYIVNEKKEKVSIDNFDTIEGFQLGGTAVDDFGFAAFVISTITFIAVIAMYFLGKEDEGVSLPSSASVADASMSPLSVGSPSSAGASAGSKKKSASASKKKKSRR